jgi:hypothetical protein
LTVKVLPALTDALVETVADTCPELDARALALSPPRIVTLPAVIDRVPAAWTLASALIPRVVWSDAVRPEPFADAFDPP